MISKEAFKWLYAIINDPKTCGGNLTENNEALNIIKEELKKLYKIEDLIIDKDILMTIDNGVYRPAKGTTKQECYEVLYNIQETLTTNRGRLYNENN